MPSGTRRERACKRNGAQEYRIVAECGGHDQRARVVAGEQFGAERGVERLEECRARARDTAANDYNIWCECMHDACERPRKMSRDLVRNCSCRFIARLGCIKELAGGA